MKELNVGELKTKDIQSFSLDSVKNFEDEVYNYYTRIRKIRKFKEVENE